MAALWDRLKSSSKPDWKTALRYQIGLFTVNTGDGQRKLVSFIPAEVAFKTGMLPQAIIGVLEGVDDRIEPETFVANREFVSFLHQVISKYGPQLPDFHQEARRLGEGSVFLLDGRTPDPLGAVEPEDIIGSFPVQQGKLVPDSYSPNPNHRLVSKRGVFILPTFFQEKLLQKYASLAKQTSS